MSDYLAIALDYHLVMPNETHASVFMPLCSSSHIESGPGSDTCHFSSLLSGQNQPCGLANWKMEGQGVAGKCDARAGSQDWVNTDKFLLFGSPISRFLTFLIMTNIFVDLCSCGIFSHI